MHRYGRELCFFASSSWPESLELPSRGNNRGWLDMRLYGIADLTPETIARELAHGARFVAFEYCISFIFASTRRFTSPYLLRPGELGLVRGLPFSLLSMLVGWWGIPWGVVYTPLVLVTNFSGGRDATNEVLAALQSDSSASPLGGTEA